MGTIDNLKRGTIELVLLSLLKEQDMYGYQLSQELSLRSDSLFTFQEGSMYPTLYRMVEKGLVSDRQELVGKKMVRVYYHIEPYGIEYLEKIKEEYFSLNRGILKIMESTLLPEEDAE